MRIATRSYGAMSWSARSAASVAATLASTGRTFNRRASARGLPMRFGTGIRFCHSTPAASVTRAHRDRESRPAGPGDISEHWRRRQPPRQDLVVRVCRFTRGSRTRSFTVRIPGSPPSRAHGQNDSDDKTKREQKGDEDRYGKPPSSISVASGKTPCNGKTEDDCRSIAPAHRLRVTHRSARGKWFRHGSHPTAADSRRRHCRQSRWVTFPNTGAWGGSVVGCRVEFRAAVG